jgi:plastocyanin
MRSLLGGDSARALVLLTLLVAFAVPLPAFAQEGAAGATGPAPVVVNLVDSKFEPEAVVALVNATVTFSNKDSVKHDVTANDFSWNSTGGPGGLAGGAKYEHVFREPGVYDYFCTLHGSAYKGMWGRVIVVAAEPKVVPGGAAEGENPSKIGVNYLAHWVGLLSFVAVVVVLLVYYFVLKYGETVHATDHRDRKEK